jgi:hypothetical protein
MVKLRTGIVAACQQIAAASAIGWMLKKAQASFLHGIPRQH